MALAVDEHLAVGVEPGPRHGILTGRYACYDVYGCADGGWLTVAAIEPRFWANLCKALGLERWIEHQTDDDLQDEIRGELAAVFRTRSRAEWVADQALPLQVHFDMKERFDLPEAVMSDNSLTFFEPVRPGDVLSTRQVLRSVSEEKTTKLGTGRFWEIDVEYRNQNGDLVGVESWTGFGYRRAS